MPTEPFLLLSSSDRMFHPTDGRCPECGGDFRRGFAYLSAGASLLTELTEDGQDSLHPDRLQGFLHVGFHGTDTEMRDSSDVVVVRHLYGGQFDLQWCSIACMREWLLKLLQEVESRATPEHPSHQEG